ncbi:MAG: hypothetical protein KGY54_14055, partial [Oleiphilaceae bacterium]|nr:hypothetical protein [Oleiphilaceae bacterium]
MKVKRFFAPSMAEALKRVREQMGPDAVILSNRRVDDGVEIVTALDYDENLARQRLGDSAVEATNGSRLAELQADQHRHLEDELGRSRDRIKNVRQKRADQGADFGNIAMASEPAVPAPANPDQALADMRAEISSLRDLVQERRPTADPERAAPAPVASQQRLTERLEEFGLTRNLAGALGRSHGKGRLDEGWKQALKTLAAGIRTPRA